MHDIGEKPGKGKYACTKCGWQVRLDDDSDRLHLVVIVEKDRKRNTKK